MSNKTLAIVWTLWGVATFLIFAYDIENDRDYWTWIWLLTSQIGFLGSLRNWIKYDKK